MENNSIKFRQQVNTELRQALDKVSDDLVKLRNQPGSELLVAAIHLRLSTMKNLVERLNLEPVSKLAAAMNKNFEGIRKGTVILDSTLAAVLITCVQLMLNLVKDPWNAIYAGQVHFSVSLLELLSTVLAVEPVGHLNLPALPEE